MSDLNQIPAHYRFRIAYADTDAGGVVYHSRYLDIFERARFDLFEQRNLSLPVLQNEGVVFVVKNMEIEFSKPARLGDGVVVETRVGEMKGARMSLKQTMLLEDGEKICEAKLSIVSLNAQAFKPCRMPERIQRAFGASTSMK